MIKRTIEVSSGPSRLFIKSGQLVLEKKEEEPIVLPSEDIGVLILDHPAITLTQGVLVTMADRGAAVVVCGPDHLPSGLLFPMVGHRTQTERHHSQIEAPQPLRKRLWQKIVAAKIAQQGTVLAHVHGKDEGLGELARRVKSGDPENLEAQAAQRYWPALFGNSFRRDRAGEDSNVFLNYSYMVLRAAVARALCASGLIPSLGVFHHNRSNPFCLADDLMEPFRPYVDLRVHEFVVKNGEPASLDKETKRHLLGVLTEVITISGRRELLSLAVQTAAQSLGRSFDEGDVLLVLPEGLPERRGEDDAQEDTEN